MGRRENELEPSAGALARFAADLRGLRRAAGNPSYRELSKRAHYSHNTLSAAASGRALPSKAVTLAFVAACGGDQGAWRKRWQQLGQELAETGGAPTGPEPPSACPVPRQLPGPPPCFVGRGVELGMLDSQLTGGGSGAATPVPISLICGGGGIGKTSLALHWGHQRLHLFPDGQLFADLRGFDPIKQPRPAATALGGFLHALGVLDAAIPRDQDVAAALYRSMLAGRRMLVVLDNVASTGQVAPLLPGDSNCAVVITSRWRLPALTARFGASSLRLGPLAYAESRDMLSRNLGPRRLAGGPGALEDIIRYCDGMPLALAIFAARASGDPDIPLQDLAAELGADADRLDVLEPGERGLSLRASMCELVQMLAMSQISGHDLTRTTSSLPEVTCYARLGYERPLPSQLPSRSPGRWPCPPPRAPRVPRVPPAPGVTTGGSLYYLALVAKALVLSGGGSVGIAWEIGVAAGLARAGVDVRDADFITGTSAGSAVGAQLALQRDLEELVSRQRQIGSISARGSSGNAAGGPGGQQMAKLFAVMAQAMAAEGPAEARRAAIGRFALDADALPEDRFVASFRYLQGEPWPARFTCTAVDALSGEFAVWDAQAGVELDRAVASSCAVPGLFAPITINGRRYIDGGMRSGTSADLARGHDRVLIISLIGAVAATSGQNTRLTPAGQLDSEIAALTKSGSVVEVINADAAAVQAMGINLMDRSALPAAVDAGIRQGESEASRLREFWSGG